MMTRLMAAMLMPKSTMSNEYMTNMNSDTRTRPHCSTPNGWYTIMKKRANAAAEVTMMMRLRFVSKYLGMNCENMSISRSLLKAKITKFFVKIRSLPLKLIVFLG